MAEKKEKTLEMRVAEMEDKLSKIHVTEEEMKAYQKVASLLGAGAVGAEAAEAPPTAATTAIGPSFSHCIIRTCIIRTCIIRTCIINCINCVNCINECTCGPCIAGGGPGGGGFGSLGM